MIWSTAAAATTPPSSVRATTPSSGIPATATTSSKAATGSTRSQFNGANINENIDISANGGRARLTRNVANIVMDLNDVEQINVAALGGADNITIGDLSKTDVKRVNVDLSAVSGNGVGDGQADTVTVSGTGGSDQIQIVGSLKDVTVNGLSAQVVITGPETGDTLRVNGGAGNDTITAVGLTTAIMNLVLDGGAGNDTITGGAGNDTLLGGDGNDAVNGGRGNDTALLGSGNDTFTWNPGDGSDVVEGQDGTDTLVFNGSNAAENFDISANGGRARLTRDVGNITMDLNGVERIQLNAFGGADAVTVGDLTGTGVTQVAVDLGAAPGSPGGDGQADTVTVQCHPRQRHHQRRQQRRSADGQWPYGEAVDFERRVRRHARRQWPWRQRHHRCVDDQGRPGQAHAQRRRW